MDEDHRTRRHANRVARSLLVLQAILLFAGCTHSSPTDFNGPWASGQERPSFSPDSFNFMVLGDWGDGESPYQAQVAKRLATEATRDHSRFIISTGDNFYPDGVATTSDPKWRSIFESVYSEPSLQVPWFVVLGNHDHHLNAQAEIDYTRLSDRWRMPDRYFAFEQPVDDTTRVLFVFLDTTPLSRRVYDNPYSRNSNNPQVQLRWLETTLAGSTAAWKIVVGHHPLYSSDVIRQNNAYLIQHLRPILERYDVQAYISGHAHLLEHLRPEGTLDYFISGAGSHPRKVGVNPASRFVVSVPGFLAVSLTHDRMVVQFVDFKGELHHETVVERAAR